MNLITEDAFIWPLSTTEDDALQIGVKNLICIASYRLQAALRPYPTATVPDAHRKGCVYDRLLPEFRAIYDSILNIYQLDLHRLARTTKNKQLEQRATDIRFINSPQQQIHNLLAMTGPTAPDSSSLQLDAVQLNNAQATNAEPAGASLHVSLVEATEYDDEDSEVDEAVYRITLEDINVAGEGKVYRILAINAQIRERHLAAGDDTVALAFSDNFCNALSQVNIDTISEAFLIFASASLLRNPLREYKGLRFYCELSNNRVKYSCPLCVTDRTKRKPTSNRDIAAEFRKAKHFSQKHTRHFDCSYSCLPNFTLRLFIDKCELQRL